MTTLHSAKLTIILSGLLIACEHTRTTDTPPSERTRSQTSILAMDLFEPAIYKAVLHDPHQAFRMIDSLETAGSSKAELQRALAYMELGRMHSALVAFERYGQLQADQLPTPQLLMAHARAATLGGRSVLADSLIERAEQQALAIGDTISWASARNLRGLHHMLTAQHVQGTADLDTALATFRHLRVDDRSMAALLHDQSMAYHTIHRLDSAMRRAYAARELDHRLGDLVGESRAEFDMAAVYADLGDDPSSMEHTGRSAALATKGGSRKDRLFAEHWLCWQSWGTLDPTELQARWSAVLQQADSLGFVRVSAKVRESYPLFLMSQDSTTLAGWGIAFAQRFDTAKSLVGPAFQFAQTEHLEELLAGATRAQCAILNYEGDRSGSLALSERMLERAKRIGDPLAEVSAQLAISSNRFALGDWQGALDAGRKGYEQAKAYGFTRHMETAMSRISHSLHRQQDHANAFVARLTRDSLLDAISDKTTARNIGRLTAEHLASEKAYADSLVHAQQIALHEATSEKQRNRTLFLAVGAGLVILGAGTFLWVDRRRRRERFAKRAALLENKALRAQMNPHFLFNALNSISGYIREQGPEQAHDFIARFGRLMRMVLENSRRTEVPLKDDLEALRLYMELEQVRTGHRFDQSITVDPELDVANIVVPPLVVQPFVENAIWHGISALDGRGRVEVGLRPSADRRQLVLSVMDNGVGRTTSARTDGKGASLGTTITRERLQLLAQQTGGEAWFRYADVEQGTCVEVIIPLRTT